MSITVKEGMNECLLDALNISDYLKIMDYIKNGTNVKENGDFQKIFNRFYRIRLSDTNAYPKFYSVFEKYRKKEKYEFEELFKEVNNATGRIDLSFSTKIYHTLNPKYPIYDNNVATMFELSTIKGKDKFVVAIQKYNELQMKYKSKKYDFLIEEFDRFFHNVKISNVKKIDYLLYWLGDKYKFDKFNKLEKIK